MLVIDEEYSNSLELTAHADVDNSIIHFIFKKTVKKKQSKFSGPPVGRIKVRIVKTSVYWFED